MVAISPFCAIRPKAEFAEQICELPYDVMSSAEARHLANGNPLSFLHISKPEIDLAPSINPYDPSVYTKGKENFQALIQKTYLLQDEKPYFYLYRQIMGNHSQIGIVALASCADYENNIIKKHELTRPDKENDRINHIEALGAQTGPVFLTYKAIPSIDQLITNHIQQKRSVDFLAKDGVRHTAWTISNNDSLIQLENELKKIPTLYIADGHHRSAAAVQIWKKRGKNITSNSARFLSVIFPHNQMQILAYNRLVKDFNNLELDRFVQEMRNLGEFEIHPHSHPSKKHEICIFMDGLWHIFKWNPELITTEDSTGQLDVSLLQKHILGPLLGIEDPRTSNRISFVGGIRGTEELEKEVRGGNWAIAFSMHPTRIEDLMQIADQGGIMPPKSTWFEPKLRDGMFSYLL